MFFKRSEGKFPDMLDVPYAVFESVFDRSFDDIKSSLWISSENMHFEGVTSSCQLRVPDDYGVEDGRTDASQLTSFGKLRLQYRATRVEPEYEYMVQAAYHAIALDLARSMHTNTDNTQFRDVLTAIFPFINTSISVKLEGLCGFIDNTYSPDCASTCDIIRLSSTSTLTFCMHPNVIHTEPPGSRNYGARMPRILSIFARNILIDVHTHSLFLYYFRSTMVASMVSARTGVLAGTGSKPHAESL
jgi:hypothetical protein